ncbi:MAG: hypothetical protein ACRENE_22980, partial [Polyangiaceae bacterium]
MKVKRVRDQMAVAHTKAAVSSHAGHARLAKATRSRDKAIPSSRPQLARAELLDKALRVRLEDEIDAALKRRPTSEGKLAGALRAIAPLSPALRASLGEATAVML